MRLHLVFFILTLTFLSSCEEPNPNAEFEKKIFQYIDVNGMGMLEDLKIQDIEKVNDTTFKATHTFTNPLFNKEMRITRNYFFSEDGSSVNDYEEISTEMKSKGEWIKSNF